MIQVKQETPALVHNLDLADGTHLRAGPEERDPLELAKQFTFETDARGGFGPGDLVLPRPDWWDPVDGTLLGALTTKDQDDRNVYEGRVTGTPKTGVNEIEIQTEGWYKNTEDDPTAQMLFIHRDMSQWTGYTAPRRINLVQVGLVSKLSDGTMAPDPQSGAPSIDCSIDPPNSGIARAGVIFDSGPGANLAQLYALFAPVQNIGAADANWTFIARIASKLGPDTFTPNDQVLTSPIPGQTSATVTSTAHDRRYAEAAFSYAVANAGTQQQEGRILNLILVGDHGIPLKGSHPSAGLLGSDMAAYIVTTWCPLINVTPNSIELTSFLIPHADFRDPETTPSTMLDKLAIWGGSGGYPLDVGCYDNRELYMKSPGNYGTQWRFRRDEGSDPKDQGSDAADRWNQVVITYNPGDGTQRTVGPVGAGCDFETDLLRITDPDHVWNRIGQPHGKRLDVGVNRQDGAILFGQLALAEANRNLWRGSVEIKGEQMTKEGTTAPPYMIRGGDTNVVEDDMDVRERRITHTKYDEKKRSNTVDVGARPDRFDTMLARAGIAVTGLITS